MIHDGAELPVDSSKKAPRQVVRVNLESWKSAGLTVQFFNPPKERETSTVESQAEGLNVRLFQLKTGKEMMYGMCNNSENCPFRELSLVFGRRSERCTLKVRRPELYRCRWLHKRMILKEG